MVIMKKKISKIQVEIHHKCRKWWWKYYLKKQMPKNKIIWSIECVRRLYYNSRYTVCWRCRRAISSFIEGWSCVSKVFGRECSYVLQNEARTVDDEKWCCCYIRKKVIHITKKNSRKNSRSIIFMIPKKCCDNVFEKKLKTHNVYRKKNHFHSLFLMLWHIIKLY